MFIMAFVPFMVHKGNLIIPNAMSHPGFLLRNLAVFGGLALWHYRLLNCICSSFTGWLKREGGRGKAFLMYGSVFRPKLGLGIGRSSKKWQSNMVQSFPTQHPPCSRLVWKELYVFPIWLVSRGGSNNALKGRGLHRLPFEPWHPFEPITLCCYGYLARRSQTDVPPFPWEAALLISSVSRSCGPWGSVQQGKAGHCGLPIFCHQNAIVITRETTQM